MKNQGFGHGEATAFLSPCVGKQVASWGMIGVTNALIVCGSLSILGALWFSTQLPAVKRWINR